MNAPFRWSTRRLADCGELLTGGTPSRSEPSFWGGGVPWISAKSLKSFDVIDSEERLTKSGALMSTLVPPGSLLFVVRGMSLAKEFRVGHAGAELAFNQDLRALVPAKGVDGRYVARFLEASGRTILGLVDEASHGTKRLTSDRFENIEVPLPPLPEQQRIAAILDKADALRAKRRAALAQLDTLTQSIFVDMFGDPATNPKGWPVTAIGDICKVKGGKRLPKGEEYSAVPTPFRYIRVLDLVAGRVNESALLYLKPAVQARISRYVVNAGDVIISIAGSIGLVAPVLDSLDGVNLTENAAKLVPRIFGQYDAQYLARCLETDQVQKQIGSHIGQVTIGKLALFRIEKLRIPLPAIDLQRQFVYRAGQVAAQASAGQRARSRADELFASLQHRAFRGEL